MAVGDPKNDIEHVKLRARIVSLLQRLYEARAILSVHFPKHNQLYSSAVLGVDADKNRVFLDELTPDKGNDLVREHGFMHVSGRLGGVVVRFRATVTPSGKDTPDGAFQADIPEMVIYEQRRNAFRVSVGAGTVIPVSISLEDESQYDGHLIDISSSGLGAYIDKDAPLEKEGKIYHCRVSLPDKTFIAGNMEIRFLKLDENLNKLQVGGQFVDLTAPQRATVDRLVMHLQRETIRKTKRFQ